MAIDVLLSVGRLKLNFSLLLGQVFRLETITGSDSYKILPRILRRAVLFEIFFFLKRGAMMNGPLVNASRGGCPP